jgi:phosphatidylinositol alpha-1,6-mannosyltransferase
MRFIGEGDDRERFEEIAREVGGAERVRFLGAVDQQRLVAAYRMADLFVMPSTGEGFGIAFPQAMASGTPALGLDVAGARGALGEGKLGAVIPKEDDLPDAITRLITKPKSDPNALSQAVRARFGWVTFQAQVGMALDRLVNPRERTCVG